MFKFNIFEVISSSENNFSINFCIFTAGGTSSHNYWFASQAQLKVAIVIYLLFLQSTALAKESITHLIAKNFIITWTTSQHHRSVQVLLNNCKFQKIKMTHADLISPLCAGHGNRNSRYH